MHIAIDDVITGALVNALAVAGRRLTTAITGPLRRPDRDLRTARWFETFQFTAKPPPGLSAEFTSVLNSDEFQAGLQELLAVRPTDGAETYAALTRHTAALADRPDRDAETRFLASYRRHVIARHGKPEPPDFQRRRRVPIEELYVPPFIIQDLLSERTVVPPPGTPPTSTYGPGQVARPHGPAW